MKEKNEFRDEIEAVKENEQHNIEVNVPDPEKTAWEMEKNGSAESGVVYTVDNSKYQAITPDKLGELKYIFQDILSGDKSAMERPEFKQLGFDKVKKALEWLAKNNDMSDATKNLLLTQGWRLNFRAKPPTPEEFITPKYIGDQATTLHPWIKETFLRFFNPLSPYRNLILSSCIGTGKSQPLNSKVYTGKYSYKFMGDIQIGDKVMSPDGTETEVVALKDWEPEDIYELEMDNGKKMRCGLHHLHHVSYRTNDNGNKIWEDVETQFILDHPEFDYEFQEVDVMA